MSSQDGDDSDSEVCADADSLDAESAKTLLRAFVKDSLNGVKKGERKQYYEVRAEVNTSG